MATTNFKNFTQYAPTTADYIIGYNTSDKEYRASVADIYTAFSAYTPLCTVPSSAISTGGPRWTSDGTVSVSSLNVNGNLSIYSNGIINSTTADQIVNLNPSASTPSLTATNAYISNSLRVGSIVSSDRVITNQINTGQVFINNPNGDSRLEVGGSGNVYIDIKKPDTDDYDLRIACDGTNVALETATGPLYLNTSTAAQNVILASGGGKVGIGAGATNPNAKLTVGGDIRSTGNLTVGGNRISVAADGVGNFWLKSALNSNEGISSGLPAWNNGVAYGITLSGAAGAAYPYTHIWYTSGIGRMLIDVNGKVGIGTTNPTSTLTVNGAASINNNLTVGGTATVAGLPVFGTIYRFLQSQSPIITPTSPYTALSAALSPGWYEVVGNILVHSQTAGGDKANTSIVIGLNNLAGGTGSSGLITRINANESAATIGKGSDSSFDFSLVSSSIPVNNNWGSTFYGTLNIASAMNIGVAFSCDGTGKGGSYYVYGGSYLKFTKIS